MPECSAITRITNLRLRTFIGFNPDERTKRQDVVINAEIHHVPGPGVTMRGGTEYWLHPSMALRFEGRDYISSFDGEGGSSLRNDLLFTVGLSFSPM